MAEGEEEDAAARFSTIYDACRQRVWAYAVSRAGRQVADEVVSETFAVAWRRLADVPEAPLPWLLGVARNVLRDNYRAEARRESFAIEARSWADRAEGDIADGVAERLAMLRALATVPQGDREILVLIAWQGLTPRDAARVVGCSPATLRVRLHRARRRLARAIDDLAAPSPPPPPVSPQSQQSQESQQPPQPPQRPQRPPASVRPLASVRPPASGRSPASGRPPVRAAGRTGEEAP